MKSHFIRGGSSGSVWAASIALLLGCSANDNQRFDDTTSSDAALSHSVPRAPFVQNPSLHGLGRGHDRGHGHGHGHGHGTGTGSGFAGATAAAGSASMGNGGAVNGAGGQPSTAGAENTAGGPWVGAGGAFVEPSVCGDGIWQRSEGCDDGNTASEDGCSANCNVEPGFVCYQAGEACRRPRCGDGYQDSFWVSGSTDGAGGGAATGTGGAAGNYYYEACDDGNSVDGDGCSATCAIESGWICTGGMPCHQMRCGDGFQDSMFVPSNGGAPSVGGASSVGGAPNVSGATSVGTGGALGDWRYEQCDDGNITSGDGCSADCNVEPGWLCEAPATPCRYPTCGDGILDWIPGPSGTGNGGASGTAGGASVGTGGSAGGGQMEGCDDGNRQNGDGCSATCEEEPGYSCWTGICKRAVCGDGVVDYPYEECDDANNRSNDGCTACRADNAGYGGGFSTGGAGVTAGFTGVGGAILLQGGATGR